MLVLCIFVYLDMIIRALILKRVDTGLIMVQTAGVECLYMLVSLEKL